MRDLLGGATNIALDTRDRNDLVRGQGQFTGDSTTYTVWSQSVWGFDQSCFRTGQTLADNVAVTVTSSSSSWKTGTSYTADQTAFVDAVIPGGTGGVVTENSNIRSPERSNRRLCDPEF